MADHGRDEPAIIVAVEARTMTRQRAGLVIAGLVIGLGLSPHMILAQAGGLPPARGPRSAPAELPRALFVSGRIMMEDGTPPPEPVDIEVVCGASRLPQTHSDSKGKFSFRLGEYQEVTSDASLGAGGSRQQRMSSPTGGNPISRAGNSLMGCDVHAVLVGYRADDVSLSQRHSMDHPDIGTIVMHRIGGVQGTTISVTSAAAPKRAKTAYEKGVGAIRKRNWGEARKQLEKAVEVYPKYSAAWFQLGIVCVQQKRLGDAQTAFSKSIEADPAFVRPYLAAAHIAFQHRRWQEVVDKTDKLIRLDPVDFPQAYIMNAVANGGMNNLDAAEKSAREAIRLDTEHRYPRAEYILGFILAKKQDYAGALRYMRSYLERSPNAADAEAIRRDVAQMEKNTGLAAANAQP